MHDHTPSDTSPNDDCTEVFEGMPALPSPQQRWTVQRKAAVIEAVRGGWMPIEEACRLRSTGYQIYRDTDVRTG